MTHGPEFLTEEGLARLTAELEQLKKERRLEVAERIQRSKDLESAANNAELDDAKNQQAFVEGRILTIENIISHASIVHHDQPSEWVTIGSTIVVQSQDGNEETYVIVGRTEADAAHGRISNESPVGMALMGHRAGDAVSVKTPVGQQELRLVRVS